MDDFDYRLFCHEYNSIINETSILFLSRIHILTDTIFDISNFKFYAEETHIDGSFTKNEKLNYFKSFFKHKLVLKNGVWITQNWTWMYFHWITDALTRLIASEQYTKGYHVILPISYKKYPFVLKSLELLNYEIFWYSEDERVSIDQLILPTQTAIPGNYNEELLKKLRAKFIKNNNTSKIIYISRKNASQRYINNEDELIDLLVQYGVDVHIFENYEFEEQIELMSKAKCVIGLHGAGLTNMLFMPEGGMVLEIRNEGDAENNCYFSMASALDLDYYYILGKGDSLNTSNVNIEVSIQNFRDVLNVMGITKIS